jgi:hypothetical protein
MIETPYSQMIFFGRVKKKITQQCAQQCQMLKPMTKAPKVGEVVFTSYFATDATNGPEADYLLYFS